ncbi:MAG: cytochrome c oxidase assembly protein [Candidatus Dormibacteria bacterium]
MDVLGHWQVNPGVVLALTLSAAVYLWGARRSGRSGARSAGGWPVLRTLAFLTGLAAVAVALESGLDGYGTQLLSIHMVGHLMLMLVAAPLLLAGAPITLALRSLPREASRSLAGAMHRRPVRALSHPGVGLLALGGALAVTHLTPVFGWALEHPLVHVLEHALYLLGGLLFWAVLIAPGPPVRRLGGLGQFLYLSVGMPMMSVVGVVLEAAPTVRYQQYVAPARAFGVSALADQRLAGVLMLLADAAAMGVIGVTAVWRAMLAEERRAVAQETYTGRAEPTAATLETLSGRTA